MFQISWHIDCTSLIILGVITTMSVWVLQNSLHILWDHFRWNPRKMDVQFCMWESKDFFKNFLPIL